VRGNRHILVVEDNAEVGEFSMQLLNDLGYHTMLACDGQSALKLLDEKPGQFDLVFSDVVMPGMDGVTLGREIRRRFPRLPVVLTSGYSHVLAEEGTHGFPLLHKPYSVENLSKILRAMTRSRPGCVIDHAALGHLSDPVPALTIERLRYPFRRFSFFGPL
jgi:CheY-like chemotaxis protein